MMNLLSKKTYAFLLLMVSILSFAQSVPPPPDNPESGDIGGYPASPIDAYTVILFLLAITMIIFFALKQKQRILE
ncbi:hypothetical protein [Epilithonimonas lactis]|nr:hypothetical protein [Epilithonimonas lactis]SEQ04149.1 hypothetical protein SAMN04488097_1115 [Epilithonimonas lactis]